VQRLAGDPVGLHVVAAARSTKKAIDLFKTMEQPFSKNISIVECDLRKISPIELSKIVKGADAVISAVGYSALNDLNQPIANPFDIAQLLPNPLGSFEIENVATRKLIDACVDEKIPKFVMISSLLANGLASGQVLNPSFVVTNVFGGGNLMQKRFAELYLTKQIGIDYTIIRSGGLINDKDKKEKDKFLPILYSSADTLFNGTIYRSQVADVVVASALEYVNLSKTNQTKHQATFSSNKIIEIVAASNAKEVSIMEGFSSVV
jgi:nucleoside-diphosphate-sugar epimerase